MKQRRLGRTGLDVSTLCLGTMQFGRSTDERTAFASLDAFFDAGGNFFQSRGIATGWGFSGAPESRSETITGEWWRSRGVPRESLVLGTGLSLCRPATGGTNAFHRVVRESVGNSLRRLQTDHLDLLVCDWCEDLLPIEDTLEAFDSLTRAGMVRRIAASSFPEWRIADALGRNRRECQQRIEGLQADYSLITRSGFESETREVCREYDLGFIASAPLARGFLLTPGTAGLLLNAQRRRLLRDRYANPYCESIFDEVHALARMRGATPAQVALAWVLGNEDVTAALIGVSSVAQLTELLAATTMDLTFHERARLDEATSLEGMRV